MKTVTKQNKGARGLKVIGVALRDDPVETDPAPSRGPREGVADDLMRVRSHRLGEPTDKMWETRSVNLNIRLPRDVARKAEAFQESDPEFLSRVLIEGLTRLSIYEHLNEHEEPIKPGTDASGER